MGLGGGVFDIFTSAAIWDFNITIGHYLDFVKTIIPTPHPTVNLPPLPTPLGILIGALCHDCKSYKNVSISLACGNTDVLQMGP